MSFDLTQFHDLVERVLTSVDERLASPAAVNLLLGTAALESAFGTYIRQLGGGPALGVFQMEPATFAWLQGHYGNRYREFQDRRSTDLEWDLRLAIVFARLRYRIVPKPLPAAEEIAGMADYWKRHYNSPAGAGTVAGFISAYRQYVNP